MADPEQTEQTASVEFTSAFPEDFGDVGVPVSDAQLFTLGQIVETRLGGFDASKFGLTSGWTQQLVRLLPPELRTEKVLSTIDLRVLLDAVRPQSGSLRGRVKLERRTVNGVSVGPKLQEAATAAFYHYTETLRGEYIAGAIATVGGDVNGGQVTPEQIAEAELFADELVREYQPGTLAPVAVFQGAVATNVESGDVSTIGANGTTTDFATAVSDLLGGSSTPDAPAFLTAQDVEFMFRMETPDSAIGAYLNELSAREAYNAQGGVAPVDTVQIQMEQGRTTPTTPYLRPGASPTTRTQAATGKPAYRLTEALNLPYDMTRQELATLTDKMKKAGLFTQIPGGEPTVIGDPTDPQFKSAYRLLLSKTIQQGRPISTLLQEGIAAHENALAEQVRARLTDPARLRLASDSMGQQLLGRKLTPQEHSKLIESIHGLQRQQAEIEFDENGGNVVDVDWEARMAEMIRGNNPGEAEANDVASQYDTFRSMLAGPGRVG